MKRHFHREKTVNSSHLAHHNKIPNNGEKPLPNFRGGFTIMELLIASSLAAILMIGILFATTQLAKQAQRQQQRNSPTEFDAALQLLHRDLRQATACRVEENQIHLQGFILLDKKNQTQRQYPAEVIYRLVEIGPNHWLMRHQREFSKLTLDDTSANLICKDITSMQLIAHDPLPLKDDNLTDNLDPEFEAENPNNETEKDDQLLPLEITDQWQPLPPAVQWTITRQPPNKPATSDPQMSSEQSQTYTLILQ